MLVHSYIYYELDDNIVSDHQWQAWAEELAVLQKAHPKLCKMKYYDKEFADWDGTTGNHLPRHIIIEQKAKYILRIAKEYEQQLEDKRNEAARL